MRKERQNYDPAETSRRTTEAIKRLVFVGVVLERRVSGVAREKVLQERQEQGPERVLQLIAAVMYQRT